jgi:Amt family ammonium transporter
MEWWENGKPSALGAASGMVAGLATITPASGFVTIPAATLIGLVGGVVCYLAVARLKTRFRYDDSLDVFGVHAMGSITGLLLLGFLASAAVNPALADTFMRDGRAVALTGSLGQFGNQLIGVLVTAALAGVGSLILVKLVGAVTELRVHPEDEDLGLDVSQHGERAYND